MSWSFRISSAALAALLIAGCGGSDSPPASFDVAAAMTGIAKANQAFALSGPIAGVTASYTVSHGALPDASFANFGPLNAFRRTVTISAANVSETVFEDDYVDLATRTFYGAVTSDGGQVRSDVRAPFPATAIIGNSGLLYDATVYDAASTAVGKAHVYWSLEAVPGNANAAYLCVNIDFLALNGASSGEHQYDCYRIAPNGDRLGMRVTLVAPAFGTVVFQ